MRHLRQNICQRKCVPLQTPVHSGDREGNGASGPRACRCFPTATFRRPVIGRQLKAPRPAPLKPPACPGPSPGQPPLAPPVFFKKPCYHRKNGVGCRGRGWGLPRLAIGQAAGVSIHGAANRLARPQGPGSKVLYPPPKVTKHRVRTEILGKDNTKQGHGLWETMRQSLNRSHITINFIAFC